MLATSILTAFYVLIALSLIVTVLTIGQPKRPTTPGVALAIIIVGVAQMAGLAYLGSQI